MLDIKHWSLSFKLSFAVLELKLCKPHFQLVTWDLSVSVSRGCQKVIGKLEGWRREKTVVPFSSIPVPINLTTATILHPCSREQQWVSLCNFLPIPKPSLWCLRNTSPCHLAPPPRVWIPVLQSTSSKILPSLIASYSYFFWDTPGPLKHFEFSNNWLTKFYIKLSLLK